MTRTVLNVIALLGLCTASFAQDVAYYNAIQKTSSSKVQPAQFKEMEEKALKDYSQAESYDLLATSFGNTTEKVWAVIYGEAYCNLSLDSDRISQVGSLVYHWYEGSLSWQGNGLSVNLTENAQSSPKRVPFESLFEQSFLMGAVGLKSNFPPLSLQKLIDIRKNQLSLWNQKRLPQTELVRRQEAILSAGHFEAYNYWLFKDARAEEFSEWVKEHQTQFQAWLNWNGKNKFSVQTPDFQRLYLLREPDGNAMPRVHVGEAAILHPRFPCLYDALTYMHVRWPRPTDVFRQQVHRQRTGPGIWLGYVGTRIQGIDNGSPSEVSARRPPAHHRST